MPPFLVLTAIMTGFYFMDREVLGHCFLIDTPWCCFGVFKMAMTPTNLSKIDLIGIQTLD